MGLVLTSTFGLIAWIVLWAIGFNALDAFLITLLVVTLGVTGRLLSPHLSGRE
jgi:hypothetical protein